MKTTEEIIEQTEKAIGFLEERKVKMGYFHPVLNAQTDVLEELLRWIKA